MARRRDWYQPALPAEAWFDWQTWDVDEMASDPLGLQMVVDADLCNIPDDAVCLGAVRHATAWYSPSRCVLWSVRSGASNVFGVPTCVNYFRSPVRGFGDYTVSEFLERAAEWVDGWLAYQVNGAKYPLGGSRVCVCDTVQLWNRGCTCGAFKAEQIAKEAAHAVRKA